MWTCVVVLLVSGCVGAMHVCHFDIPASVDGVRASSSGSASHDFCAVCSLAHSPSVALAQVTISPVVDCVRNLSVPVVVFTVVLQSFALSVRPPPAS